MTLIAIIAYAAALLLANLSAAKFGPWVTPINAFLLIGLDLALRDLLHARLRYWQMAVVIVGTAALSWLISKDAGRIAIAGALSFGFANAVDWYVFVKVKGAWSKRAHISNTSGAAVDSLLFPILAFGSLLPMIILGQFAAKTLGAALWVKLIERTNKAAKQGEKQCTSAPES